MASSVGSDDGDLGFQIAPMVDVVFVLLLFFLAVAAAKLAEGELEVDLAKRGEGVSPTPPIFVDISASGEITVNSEIFAEPKEKELTRLRGWLTGTLGEFGDSPLVVLRPSADARHERIVDVLDACAASGITKLTFQ